MFNSVEESRSFLESANVFYSTRKEHQEWNEEYPEGHKWHEKDDNETRTLNMNDTFGWALAYGESVPDEKMVEVANLFWRYGQHGLVYWCAEKEGWERSEFEDVTRGIEFVRHEEALRSSVEGSSARAYKKFKYVLGGTTIKQRKREINRRFFWRKIEARKFFKGFYRGLTNT